MPRKYTPEELINVFWSRVNKDGSIPEHCPELGNCWEWKAGKFADGYGTCVGFNSKSMRANRFSWLITNGEIPNGLGVLHKCDNPKCVNPDHLFLGTQLDNVHDMEEKWRDRKALGEQNGRAIFTNEQITEMRETYKQGNLSIGELARLYGISRPHVSNIIKRKIWKHLP